MAVLLFSAGGAGIYPFWTGPSPPVLGCSALLLATAIVRNADGRMSLPVHRDV